MALRFKDVIMSLRFCDSFDHYATADLLKKYTSTNGSPTIQAGSGRRSTASLRCPLNANAFVALTLDAQSTWIVGCALRFSALPVAEAPLIGLYDAAAALQCDVRMTTAGLLSVTRNGTSLGVSSSALSPGTDSYLELRAVIHTTTGAMEARVNGVAWVALTNVNTQAQASASASHIRLGVLQFAQAGQTADFDDLYICDGTGSAPHNTFLGDCRVDTLLPTSDGTSQQWTPSTPGTHYTLVDDSTPNTTDYVASQTVGHRETYGMQDLSAVTGTIYGVQVALAALKSDAGARSVKPLLLSGASEGLGTTAALSTSQTYTRHLQTTDPATGVAWTESAINAMQAGAEVA